MSVDPQILALIIRRTRQLKRVKYPPTQETLIEYVRERLDVSEETVVEQLDIAVQNGHLKERAVQANKNYISYTFPEGVVHKSPLAKSPSPTAGQSQKKPLRPVIKSPPFKSPSLKSPASAAVSVRSPKTPLKTPLKSDIRPELVIDEGKDLSKHIKTALQRMERPYGSSIKVLTQYFESRFKVKIKVGKDGDRDKTFHKALVKSAILGVKRGILAKKERMFRIAPLHLYKAAPDGPITEKLQSAFLTVKKEKERAKKPATRNLLCSFCMKPEAENREGKAEQMVTCVTCGNSGHPSCLKWSEELTNKVRSLASWECLECKWCSVCREAGGDSMLFCDCCDRGYHLECCEPVLTKPPKGDWSCLLCLFERYDADHMAAYLETHKFVPGRRPSITGSAVKYQLSPNKKTPKSKKDGEGTSSEEDDLPLRSSSAEGTSTGSGRKKGRNGDDPLSDSLSKFFTPTNKRQSSVARRSFESLVALARERKHQKNSRHAADKLVKRSRNELNRQTLNEKLKQQQKQRKTSVNEEFERFEELPEHCNSTDVEWYKKSEQEAKQAIGAADEAASPDSGRYPPVIVFGRFQIQTWYSAPYPQEYAKLPKLWICEFCLQYAKSRSVLERHMVKCDLRCPPGDEIYRNGALSIFEVDGQTSKLYCQNLCLLAKLFLDHKTLYYDVEPFLFYVLTVNDQYGSHLAGYFSKEKHCAQKYNVSCIMILPIYQRTGYGRFLVSFSYLLSRQENQPGTPERPLSELGRLAYQAYWRDQVLEYLVKNPDTPTLVIHDISQRTGMSPHDIAATMQELGLVRTASDGSDRLVVVVDEAQLRNYKDRISKKPPIATVEPSALRWTPPVSNQSNGVPSLAPPPMHNEFIEHLKANPPVVEQKKRRKRKRKMSPWRRQRIITAAARKKRLLNMSKTESKSEDEANEKNEKSEEESESEGGETKKVKRESRSRKRTDNNTKRDQSSSSSSEGEDSELDEEDDEDGAEDDNGDDKKPDPDDDSGSNSGSGSQNGDAGSSSDGHTGGSGSSSNHETESQSGSSYTTASDSGNQHATQPIVQEGEKQEDAPKSRFRRSTIAQTKTPKPDVTKTRQGTRSVLKSKGSDQNAAVEGHPEPDHEAICSNPSSNSCCLQRPCSSASSTTSKMEVITSSEQPYITIARPLPSTKETLRARRSGIRPHRLVSVLQTEDPLALLLHRKTGPIPRPGRVSSVASMSVSTTLEPCGVSPMPGRASAIATDGHYVMVDEFSMVTSAPMVQSTVVTTVAPPMQTSPTIQLKVEAAVANFRKEQKVLTELAPTVMAGVGDMNTMPIMPISFFSTTDLAGDEMSLPPPPSATVATVAQFGSSMFSSPEFTTLSASSNAKFATLKALSPPKNGKLQVSGSSSQGPTTSQFVNFGGSALGNSQFDHNSLSQQAYANFYHQQNGGYNSNSQPVFGSTQATSSSFSAPQFYSQPTSTSYYNQFLTAPSETPSTNFDLAAAAASLMQSQNPFFAKHPFVPGSTGGNAAFYPSTSAASISSPQPAAAPVYQALGGIDQSQQFLGQQQQYLTSMMPQQQNATQQFGSTPNLQAKWF